MNTQRIAAISRLFAGRKSEQSQAATTSIADHDHGPTMLFVQSFESGSIAPKAGADDRYTVTLEHGLGQTLFFSDRPERVVGSNPTGEFLEGLGFQEENPPNAALLMEAEDGNTEIAVVELLDPTYDPAGPTVTYDITPLKSWASDPEAGFTPAEIDLASLAPVFGTAHLFIDDCADVTMTCVAVADDGTSWAAGTIESSTHDGFCYSWGMATCYPCIPWFSQGVLFFRYWSNECNSRFPECQGLCQPINMCAGWRSECITNPLIA